MTKRNEWAVEVLEGNMGGMDREERQSYLEDVTNHGCQSGCVGGVIYYSETRKLFIENIDEILGAIDDYAEETEFNAIGYQVEQGNTYNIDNYLVWFIVEITAQEMLNALEEAEEEEEEYQY